MFSTPLICSSSGVATASASTRGLAPGYTARTTTEGGTTSGYSLTGSANMAIAPAMKITMESTPAKIGRSMKNREKRIGLGGRRREAQGRAGTDAPVVAVVIVESGVMSASV